MSGGEHKLSGTTLRQRTQEAIADEQLRINVAKAVDRFAGKRTSAMAEIEDADGLRVAARAAKQAVLADLPAMLDRFADAVIERGGHVHWAPTTDDAVLAVRRIVRDTGGRTIVKSKSMATEEIDLNQALEADGCEVVETDLGEWIIQLARQTPSHIIAPALHHDRHSILEVFRAVAGAPDSLTSEPTELNKFARASLREHFLRADVGITGANFGVVESGSIVLVTNEGNGRMVTSLPRVHIVLMGAERLVETWDQLDLMLQLLTRSASGQRLSSYTTVVSGPRRTTDADGPDELHVVVLDGGRSALLGTELHEMLACIRCGACLNACPVYRQIGGHAYGWVYTGPMGAVLTPLLAGHHPEAAEVANASTLCGACMDACPVQIPLQDLLLELRQRKAEHASVAERSGWRVWAELWSHPGSYRASTKAATWGRRLAAHARLVPGAARWAADRELPPPARRRFRDVWSAGEV